MKRAVFAVGLNTEVGKGRSDPINQFFKLDGGRDNQLREAVATKFLPKKAKLKLIYGCSCSVRINFAQSACEENTYSKRQHRK